MMGFETVCHFTSLHFILHNAIYVFEGRIRFVGLLSNIQQTCVWISTTIYLD